MTSRERRALPEPLTDLTEDGGWDAIPRVEAVIHDAEEWEKYLIELIEPINRFNKNCVI